MLYKYMSIKPTETDSFLKPENNSILVRLFKSIRKINYFVEMKPK
jgi:hypothetical protein